MIESAVLWLLNVLAAPAVGPDIGLPHRFVSATLVPLGSEPAVFAVVKANPAHVLERHPGRHGRQHAGRRGRLLDRLPRQVAFAKERKSRWFHWLERYGAKTMLLSWVPGIGDPLCTLAGWLHLPFWPSVMYMAIGKFGRYLTMTATLLLYVPDGWWHRIGQMLG
jgi:membrane protein YqaA with SNARE-associated domain